MVSLGGGAGSEVITNRPSWISYDPANPAVFYESGICNGGGVYKTINGGVTFQRLGSNVGHIDFVSVDYTDPNRQTLLAGGHEQAQTVWKSTDGGQNWTNIGLNLPAGTGFSTSPLVINAQTYVVNTDTSWGGGTPGIYRTVNGGTTWTKVSSLNAYGPPLLASNGNIYWVSGNRLLKSVDSGINVDFGWKWSRGNSLIELADGRIVSSTATNLMASSDGGLTWTAIGAALPFFPHRVIYSATRQAFFISKWDCGNVVLSDAIAKLDYAVVTPAPPQTPVSPTVAFSANPTSIASGKVSTMNWSSTNAASCTAAGGWTGTKAPSGTLVVSPPNTTTYMLTCTGSGGTSPAASTTVAVNASQTPVSGACGSANGTTVSSAPSTNLCTAGTASSVAGSGPWTWNCSGSNGGASASCSASASVAGGPTPPSTPSPSPSTNCKRDGSTPAATRSWSLTAMDRAHSGWVAAPIWMTFFFVALMLTLPRSRRSQMRPPFRLVKAFSLGMPTSSVFHSP